MDEADAHVGEFWWFFVVFVNVHVGVSTGCWGVFFGGAKFMYSIYRISIYMYVYYIYLYMYIVSIV